MPWSRASTSGAVRSRWARPELGGWVSTRAIWRPRPTITSGDRRGFRPAASGRCHPGSSMNFGAINVPRSCRSAFAQGRRSTIRDPASGPVRGPAWACISAGMRASSSMSVDHAPWSSEMPSGRGWKPGLRRGQPRCPRRPSAGPAPLRWDMNYPPTNKSRCSTPIHAIGLSTTTARASALVPDPYRVRAACPQRVRWSQCGQSTDRH